MLKEDNRASSRYGQNEARYPDGCRGSSGYFRRKGRPKTPKGITVSNGDSLRQTACTAGNLTRTAGQIHVDGPLIFNSISLILDALAAGFGLAFLSSGFGEKHLREKQFIQVRGDGARPGRATIFNIPVGTSLFRLLPCLLKRSDSSCGMAGFEELFKIMLLLKGKTAYLADR
ncbi:hypothetical protein Q2380_04370 [Enterobacter hormaechei]|uniref:hypothetical protein n=1 Tax=Enterobacter hormaechei TaxID=158836 RepID=UPI000797B26C|nr:hypothetical protein [Enterobacter hormaechei]MDO2404113.1 hypothetical protein [Enterobacter hormaechei]MDO2426254.1 hypothetical protein [Enterobacter hormaechei]CZY22672.1 Transcriptional regulator%2C LysR family [Enterobacter hormaechei]